MPDSGNLILPLISSSFFFVPLRNLHGQKQEEEGWSKRLCTMLTKIYCRELRRCSSRSFLPWGSCNNQCVESGVFPCQLLELVSFVIWGRGQLSAF